MLYIYLYSVTSVSLFVFVVSMVAGVNGLAEFLFNAPLSPYEMIPAQQGPLVFGLGYALISLPIWLYHWRWLTRESERFQETLLNGHRFYLFTVICLSVMMGIVVGGTAFSTAIRLLLGIFYEQAESWSQLAASFTLLLVAGGLWLHHWRQFRGRFGDMSALLKPA